jgi:hypothetical protein
VEHLNPIDQKSSLVDKIKSSGRINFNKALSAINGIYYTSNPIASLASGTFFSNKSITLSSATSGATIYYTTNDSTPTISSTLYSEPITISSNTTLKAIAMKDGMENSDVMTEVYTTTTNTPIYRLYNTRTGVHLYTKGESGRDAILDKWSDFQYTDSGPTFYAEIL